MKKILVVAAAITFSLGLNAQTKETEQQIQDPKTQEQKIQDPAVQEHKMHDSKATDAKMKDCVMIKDGNMISMVN